ncbi:MAG: transposase [Anaerolineae bacterium]|jgi:DNA-binding CsgD family transcriptional regulator|nr:transposase [Anaerolineae bacterium]MBT7988508.1 transposase [Anaerolineae bacterium]
MPKKQRYSTEQIIRKLREADVLLSQDKSVEEIAKALEISKQTLSTTIRKGHHVASGRIASSKILL